MNMWVLLGLLGTGAGCACIYLASPNQGWRTRTGSSSLYRLAGAALLLLGWTSLLQNMQRLTACFVFATAVMVFLILFPYASTFIKRRRGA